MRGRLGDQCILYNAGRTSLGEEAESRPGDLRPARVTSAPSFCRGRRGEGEGLSRLLLSNSRQRPGRAVAPSKAGIQVPTRGLNAQQAKEQADFSRTFLSCATAAPVPGRGL